MVFLTSLSILDTGYLTVASRTNQLAAANRVAAGVALGLKGVDITITSSANLDTGVTPAFIPSTILGHEKRALVSINPMPVKIVVVLNADNTSTSNYYGINDMSLLPYLLRLPLTKGFKAIYYPVDNTTTDTGGNSTNELAKQIVYALGATDTAESQGDINLTIWTGTTTAASKDLTDVNYIPVRFTDCQVEQGTTNKIIVTLNGVVTG